MEGNEIARNDGRLEEAVQDSMRPEPDQEMGMLWSTRNQQLGVTVQENNSRGIAFSAENRAI